MTYDKIKSIKEDRLIAEDHDLDCSCGICESLKHLEKFLNEERDDD